MVSYTEIKKILPHRYPMLLVDAVVSVNESSLIARKNITSNEPCFAGLNDTTTMNDYAYPSTLIIESFSQSAGILYSLMHQDQIISENDVKLFGAISNFQFIGQAFPGETLEYRVNLDRAFEKEAFFSGEVWVGEKCIATVERIIAVVRPADALENF
jgi:3-hydroxyacyl-[acyl-carrier-protein] dehydratase